MSSVVARRPGARSLLVMIGAEARMVVRDTAGLVVPLGLPLLLLLTNAGPASSQVVEGGMTALDLFVLPRVIAIIIASIGAINMPSFLAYYRRAGVLRRLAVTPASPIMVLVAQVVVSALQTALGIGIAFTVATVAFGASVPANLGGAIGVLVLASAAMYAVGMVVAAVAPTPNSAVAIGLTTFFVLGALGGMFTSRDALPAVLADVGAALPFGAAVDALVAAWSGAAVTVGQLASFGVTIAVGVGVAAVLFRWE